MYWEAKSTEAKFLFRFHCYYCCKMVVESMHFECRWTHRCLESRSAIWLLCDLGQVT